MGITKGLCYYTDNRCQEKIVSAVRTNLSEMGYPIVSVSLKPLPGFGKNIVVDMEPGIETMFKQILIGLEASESDVIFLTEHDVLYDPSHFEFTPPKEDVFYYNVNTWVVNAETKKGMVYNEKQVSGLCAYRELLIRHYRKRIQRKYSWRQMGYEPGVLRRSSHMVESWKSENPNIDIRHGNNLTTGRFANLR